MPQFTLKVVGCQTWNRHDDNVDVIVQFPNDAEYSATFFTLRNIQSLMESYRITGECARGLYFWASEMIIVEELSIEIMEQTVESLLRDNEFSKAFHRLE